EGLEAAMNCCLRQSACELFEDIVDRDARALDAGLAAAHVGIDADSIAVTHWGDSTQIPSRGGGDQEVLCLLEKLDDLLSIDGWESGQKVVDRLSGFQVVEERLDRHPSAGKDRGAPHRFGAAG